VHHQSIFYERARACRTALWAASPYLQIDLRLLVRRRWKTAMIAAWFVVIE
jgi:hypothetical protein